MTIDDIDAIMVRQAELIAALDAQDASAITIASEALAAAVANARNHDAGTVGLELSDMIGNALQQNRAAAMRANSLLHWTRQRIGKINELRGLALAGSPRSY